MFSGKKSLAACVAAIGTLTFAPATEAHAYTTYPCPGNVVRTWPLLQLGTGGSRYATMSLYWSSANGGTSCVQVFDNETGSHYMAAEIEKGAAKRRDAATYANYAGGNDVCTFTNMGTAKIWIWGYVETNGTRYWRASAWVNPRTGF